MHWLYFALGLWALFAAMSTTQICMVVYTKELCAEMGAYALVFGTVLCWVKELVLWPHHLYFWIMILTYRVKLARIQRRFKDTHKS
jgi:hypothetical protein